MSYYDKYLKYKLKYTNLKGSSSFIKNLEWRRAEKHFAPGPVDIESIKSAILNAPSSFGIQPFHVLVITNQEIKKKLKEACDNQSQIEESYCLFIFCALDDLEKRIDQYIEQTGFVKKRKSMINYISKLPCKLQWAMMQAYIALGFGMAAAMELNIASCPMEGFKPDEVSKVLNLDKNLKPCVLLTVGNKRNDYELEKRFRFSKEDMFTLYN
jgi:nitroreductase